MFQQALLDRIRKRLPSNTSLIDGIANALDISYDAAHRRTSLKSKFSLAESMQLARRFNISLDGLLEVSSQDTVAVQKTTPIHCESDLQAYFERSYKSLSWVASQTDSSLLYSAKDIPLFYLLKGDLLTRFKIYVWLKLLDPTMAHKRFSQLHPKLATMASAKQLGGIYEQLEVKEIWDVTTVNSTLKQIHFYLEAGMLATEVAIELCHAVQELIHELAMKVGRKDSGLSMYYNELLLMNNQVLVQTPRQQSLYVPFSMLSYYLTNDEITCKQAETYFMKQLEHSKLLDQAGEKERNSFFNKILAKVDALKQLISAKQLLDFE
ncbi:MAG: hypothetical protein AAFP76_12195 [Bacteroidota bacterium]